MRRVSVHDRVYAARGGRFDGCAKFFERRRERVDQQKAFGAIDHRPRAFVHLSGTSEPVHAFVTRIAADRGQYPLGALGPLRELRRQHCGELRKRNGPVETRLPVLTDDGAAGFQRLERLVGVGTGFPDRLRDAVSALRPGAEQFDVN